MIRLFALTAFILMPTPVTALLDRFELSRDYGKAGAYTVGYSENGICVARRIITIRDLEGVLHRGGTFAFGVAEHVGRYVTFISFGNPHWNFQIGRTGRGKVIIDGIPNHAVFVTDGDDIATAILPEMVLSQIGEGGKLQISAAGKAYSFHLEGGRLALWKLKQCIRYSLKTPEAEKRVWGGTQPALP